MYIDQDGRTRCSSVAGYYAAKPYEATPDGIVYRKMVRGSLVTTPLCNFVAYMMRDRPHTPDYLDMRPRIYAIELTINGRTTTFEIAAQWFHSLGWLGEKVGSAAVVYAGKKNRVREAIQLLSIERRDAEARRQVYSIQNADGSWSLCSRAQYEQKAKGEVGR